MENQVTYSVPANKETTHEAVLFGKLATNQFLMDHNFIMNKLVNGKLYCDQCKNEFPAITVFFIVADDNNRTVKCHPCNGILIPERIQRETKKQPIAPEGDQLSLF